MDYDNRYFYDSQSNNPYAVDLIQNQRGGEENFEWDKKGNMIFHLDRRVDKERHFSWTEDNRLEAVFDNNISAFYNYDASGERNLKLIGTTVSVLQNGKIVNTPVFDRQVLYASALLTIHRRGYTKHYFEEGNRICSSIGSGGLNLLPTTQAIADYWSKLRENPNPQDGVVEVYKRNFGVGPYIDKVEDLYDVVEKYSDKENTYERVFYHHTDHLGSTTLVTDDNADVVQQIAYLPYGEEWVNIRHRFGSAYKFNGKEKDDETGYSYYGARYYTDRLSIWLSVDPLADKYPHLSPYAYCADNPVMLVDPDGNSVFPSAADLRAAGGSVINDRKYFKKNKCRR